MEFYGLGLKAVRSVFFYFTNKAILMVCETLMCVVCYERRIQPAPSAINERHLRGCCHPYIPHANTARNLH